MKLPLRVLVAAALIATATVGPMADGAAPTLRLTSPLGRTGLPGTIRIVARLEAPETDAPLAVHFYVDGVLLATDSDGPPYEANWVDDNPFEARELFVETELESGARVSDKRVLKPLEITDAVEVASVAVDVSVLDSTGRFASNLKPGDFQLFENGQVQELDQVTAKREPGMFTLLVDSSQSMAIRTQVVRNTAAHLVDALSGEDQVVVAPFSKAIASVTGPTTDRQTVLDAITAIRHSGGTAILDALVTSATSLQQGTRRHALILITDGYDENSASDVPAALAALRAADTTLYVLGVGGIAGTSLKGEKVLSQLAGETGGRAWFPRDERHLRQIYDTIAGDVQQKYLLTYTPQDQRRDGTWRKLELKVPPGLRVRARNGYTAPEAPPIRASMEFTAVADGDLSAALMPDDVVLLEDGVAQKVDTFHESVLPVTIMFALDSSGSMKRSAEKAQEAARGFVVALRPEDEMGLIVFADKANYIHSPTERRDWTLKAIDTYLAAGGTALYDALYDSLAQVAVAKGRRVVVVVTDGRDENATSNGPGSKHTWEEVFQKLHESEATVYAIGIGSTVDRGRLQQIADASSGAAYFPADVTTLSADYNRILDELRRRYVIGWESTNRKRDGAYRRVDIRPRGEGIIVRSRGGYYAPPQ